MTETVKCNDIIKNHKLFSSAHAATRKFSPSIISLGYITPVSNGLINVFV